MKNQDLDTLINEALGNIRDDRKSAKEFLNEIATQIAKDPEQNKYLSPVAAKHVETMQRSNEQLVKIIGLRQKTHTQIDVLSDKDKDSIFDMLQGEVTDGV
jgi:wobble nucleotide-excising tRNase